MQRLFLSTALSLSTSSFISTLLYLFAITSMLGLLSGCSVMAAISYYNGRDDSEPVAPMVQVAQLETYIDGEPATTVPQSLTVKNRLAEHSEEHRIGEMVIAVSAAIDAPMQSESLDTIARYGTDSRYYVMIRGWLSQTLSGVQSQLDASQGRSDKAILQQKSDFLQASIRRIDLE